MTIVRKAVAADVPRIHELILALAAHHELTMYVRTSPEELLSAGFGQDPKFGVLLAETDRGIVGFVSYTLNYSIWLGHNAINVDDVYVDEVCRGQGVGEALMREVRKEMGGARVRWEVEADNVEAIRFYERLGAKHVSKEIFRWESL